MAYAPTQVAREFLKLGNKEERPLTPLELIKLTYLAHGWNLALNGNALVNEKAEAWTYGPVFPSLYHALKGFRGSPVTTVPITGSELFDDGGDIDAEPTRVIRSVFNSYKKYNGIQLSELTHQEGTSWSETRKKGAGSVIGNRLLKRHFEALAEERNVRGRGEK